MCVWPAAQAFENRVSFPFCVVIDVEVCTYTTDTSRSHNRSHGVAQLMFTLYVFDDALQVAEVNSCAHAPNPGITTTQSDHRPHMQGKTLPLSKIYEEIY